MTDWREAGRKADAHRIRDLYRGAFASVTTVLDLWGGGVSARDLTAAGFRVISVDDGSMELTDQGLPVSRARKRRALEYTAAEDGYEARFGKAETFANEADGAYLDFCGPWTTHTRRTVAACRHMNAVAVTLTPDHDVASGAINAHERQMAYQMFLKMAWSGTLRWNSINAGTHVRRLLDYRRTGGFAVFLYLLSHRWLRLAPISLKDREQTRPDMLKRHRAIKRSWYIANRDRLIIAAKARATPRTGPFTCICSCGAVFTAERPARHCSERCRRRVKTERQRQRREMPGVFGTPDEAISD